MVHSPKMGTMKQPEYLTVRQVADLEGVTVWAIHRRIKKGRYPGSIRTASQHLIPAEAVQS